MRFGYGAFGHHVAVDTLLENAVVNLAAFGRSVSGCHKHRRRLAFAVETPQSDRTEMKKRWFPENWQMTERYLVIMAVNVEDWAATFVTARLRNCTFDGNMDGLLSDDDMLNGHIRNISWNRYLGYHWSSLPCKSKDAKRFIVLRIESFALLRVRFSSRACVIGVINDSFRR